MAETQLHTIVDSPDRNKVDISKAIVDKFGHEFGQTIMFFRTKAEGRAMQKYLDDKGYKAL